MIYPKNFEQKIGFTEVRSLLRARCLSPLGKEQVDAMAFSTDATQVNTWMEEIREFRRIQEGQDDFPLDNFFDVRESVARIRLEGTYMEVEELFDLKRSLETNYCYCELSEPWRGDGTGRNTSLLPCSL